MGLDIVFVFFVIRLVSTLSKDLGIDGCNFPRKLDGDLLGFSRQFI